MTQLQCADCGSALAPEDVFCGGCGIAVRAADRGGPLRPEPVSGKTMTSGTTWPDASVRAPAAPVAVHGEAADTAWWNPEPGPEPADATPGQFFGHAASQPDGPLSNATRYLCAAAYLNPDYANRVIGELVASHRAVAPSLGIDLVPVIRHCLDARKMQLLRDILLSVLLALGLFLATVPTLAILAISFCLGFIPGVQWERRSLGVKVLAIVGIVLVLAAIGGFSLFASILNTAGRTVPNFGPLATGGPIIGVTVAFLVLVGTVLAGYSYSMYRIFSDRLRPGARPGLCNRAPEDVEARIAEVAAAQRGNMTIYGGDNPFIGTGSRLRGEDWSIAIELDRAPGPGKNAGRPARKPGSYVPIDPVELHQALRARLLKVRDEELPVNERISALSVHDHLVGDGHCRWDNPVIDQARTIPYSQASPEAIDAVIRHPAAGLRYYLRVCVSDEGQPVWARRREVIGGTDHEIAVSAFVYVAVEGRMFYLQFIPTSLPPVRQEYHIVDRLPKATSSEFMAKVVLHAARASFHHMVRAPFGVIGTVWRILAEQRSFRSEARSADDYVFADMGARVSVRESGGAGAARTFIQVLDTAKYIRIVQRLVLDTVLDFLNDKGVDTSAYQQSANAIISNSYTIHGNVGSMATGSHGRAESHVSAASAGASGPRS